MDYIDIITIVIIVVTIVINIYNRLKEWKITDVFTNINQEIKLEKVDENLYKDYTKFYKTDVLNDPDFVKKIKIIYSQIVNKKETDIKVIAELAHCTYPECILKIKYLKQIRKIKEDYYIDEVNGLINKCSQEDQKLLQKYRPYIYRSQLQIPEIAAKLPKTTNKNRQEVEKQILNDLIYLDDKGLIDGILLNRVDGMITYYNYRQNKNMKDKITVNCQNCGAPNEVNRGGKIRCSYCGSIVEDSKKPN